jgi:hypothetical protein
LMKQNVKDAIECQHVAITRDGIKYIKVFPPPHPTPPPLNPPNHPP